MIEAKDIPEATTAVASNINAIAENTVHKICSGQVVLNLAVAVKELVENAIDAGATLVEVKLCDHGLESLEVSDNGSGVEEQMIMAMTAKYHTSKLREFVDLQGVETFGFRGEALSSLCALADMQIITRHKNNDAAIKVDLDHEGKIKQRSSCARAIGTTVTLKNLFVTLPVRRRDFMRNIKKEFNKMCQMLQAYCLVSVGVRIICSNVALKGQKTTVLQTHGVGDVLANVTSIFGSKQTNAIIRIKSPYDDNQSVNISDLQEALGESMQISDADLANYNEKPFHLEGYVSTCSHGAGRAAKDRQFFYVNSRPCDFKNLSKVVNDMYHRYNAQQYPFVFLNVKTTRADVDVNLTPDKRQLLIHNEKLLLLALKQSLLKTYGHVPAIYKVQNMSIISMLQQEKNNNTEKINGNDEANLIPMTSTQNYVAALKEYSGGVVKRLGRKRKCIEAIDHHTAALKKIQLMLSEENKNLSYKSEEDEEASDIDVVVSANMSCSSTESSPMQIKSIVCKGKRQIESTKNVRLKCLEFTKTELKFNQQEVETNFNANKKEKDENAHDVGKISTDDDVKEEENISITSKAEEKNPMLSQSHLGFLETDIFKTLEKEDVCSPPDFVLDGNLNGDEELSGSSMPTTKWCITMLEIEQRVTKEQKVRRERKEKLKFQRLRFKSEINPTQNSTAEAELQKEITKEDFGRMEILGQFNLGFIIVLLGGDLFIVDQHATDEKYNFEILQRDTVLQYQKLAMPQPLELTAVNELVLMQHLSVFERNGFKFDIDENAPSTRKIRLLGKPFSKNWEFGKEDIDELIFMLQDAPEGTECRPSRIRAMFASRACRKSVMIGTALTKKTMHNLIRHMGEIEQPWNCPHGRPTMRHLINTSMLIESEEEENGEINNS